LRFFHEFGKERSAKLQFIYSDMWAPYLKVIAKKAPQALNILDRFHVMKKINLSSIKGYLMRKNFQQFWTYQCCDSAGRFLDNWVTRTLKTDLEPMKKVAKMLRKHKPLILNWFREGKRTSFQRCR